jgi:GPH family glycoside/pentoside/hexuronide:cation symporter
MNGHLTHETPRVRPLRYALGELGLHLPGMAVGTYMVFFYTDVLALPVAMVALARGINSVWDGINDPIFAHLSDRTRSRWGRRRPWLWSMLPLSLIAWVLFWAPPANLGHDALFLWFLGFLLLFETAATISWVNYNALFPRLFVTEAQRVRANAVRRALGMVALVGAVALSPLLYGPLGFAGMGLIWAGLGGLAFLVFLLGLRENAATAEETRSHFTRDVRELLKNPAYRLFLGIHMLGTLATGLLMVGMPFYARYSLGLPEAETALLFAAVFVTAIPGVSAWIFITRRLGAARSWQVGMGWFMVSLLPLAVVAWLPAALAAAALVGFGLSGWWVLGDVVLARIIDDDVRRHGQHREAMFFGLAAVMARLTGVLNALSFALLTVLFGYVSGVEPGPNPDGAFRFLLVVIPGVSLLLAVGLTGWLTRLLRPAEAAAA